MIADISLGFGEALVVLYLFLEERADILVLFIYVKKVEQIPAHGWVFGASSKKESIVSLELTDSLFSKVSTGQFCLSRHRNLF